MKQRIITATVMILVLVPILVLSMFFEPFVRIMEVLLIAVTVGASLELLFMYDKKERIPLGVKITSVILTLLLYFNITFSFYGFVSAYGYNNLFEYEPIICKFIDLIHFDKFLSTPITSLTIIFIIYMSLMVLIPKFNVSEVGGLFISTIYVSVCVGAFTVLYMMGLRYVAYILLITVFTDIFALVFGRKFGKHKMAPVTSPKKTWEGSIGGTITALVVGCAFIISFTLISDKGFFRISSFEDLNLATQIIICIFMTLALSVCSQIGDLLASKLKRAYGIKDYSNIFPGHGGILDRFDSTFFASAIFMLIVILMIIL
ncbi:MAG: phosphatidate cytidylyltransferase [Acholeplasmatales bacterium]|nr:phosphatidate cytidylyltransferase [Acholeplasmatales bacterium]